MRKNTESRSPTVCPCAGQTHPGRRLRGGLALGYGWLAPTGRQVAPSPSRAGRHRREVRLYLECWVGVLWRAAMAQSKGGNSGPMLVAPGEG